MTPSKLLRLVVRLAVAVAVLFAAALVPAHAQQAIPQTSPPANQEISVPRLVQFNGTLKDAAARPVTGVASVTFAIYAEQDGGAALWSETQNVIADASGHYNALLGGATPAGMPAELFGTGQSRWLGVTIARQPEMARALLASVPYALKAGDAETLGGLPASAYVTTQSLAAAKSSATTILAPGSTTIAAAPENSVTTSSSEAPAASLPISNATPTGGGTTNYVPLWASGTNLGNSLLYQTGGKIGIGTTAPTQTLDVNGNSIFRGSFQLPPGHDATSAAGYESHSFQFEASSFNSGTNVSTTQAFSFRAEPLNNNTTNPSAKLDFFFVPDGSAVMTDTGLSFSSAGIVTFAPGQTFSGASETLTGSLTTTGDVNSQNVFAAGTIDAGGNLLASGNVSAVDVIASGYVSAKGGVTVTTTADTALYGNSSAQYGSGLITYAYGQFGYGVTAEATDVGIYASGSGYAGQFFGNVSINGTLTNGGGAIKIDDPIDPANKYLEHSAVVSPDMLNIYNGNVTTDATGTALVTMPVYFNSLNRDFRYQLTVIGQFAQAIVASEMANGAFTIKTDKPNVKVSWMVTGIRQDAWANAHRIDVEVEKPADEKGHYSNPELYGHAGEPNIIEMQHQRSVPSSKR
ncbi:MAG TPA: hypothetical protein VGD60_02140 [Candidatus Acidoferrales bacterium]